MIMLIVIEGPDRVGKSTLVAELRKHLTAQRKNVVSFHCGAPQAGAHPLDDYARPISVYTPSGHARPATSIIADRLHIGDLVYGPVYRGEQRQSPEMVAFMKALIEARGGICVHMTASADLIKYRINREGEENSYLKNSEVDHVVREFGILCSAGWSTVDTTKWMDISATRQTVVSIVDAAANREKAVAPIYRVDQDYIGASKPRALFVGTDTTTCGSYRDPADRPSDLQPSYGAFTPWEDTPDELLIGCMIDAGIDISADIGLTTTACPDFALLHEVLGKPRVVALGAGAEQFVLDRGVTLGMKIDHPVEVLEDSKPKAARAKYVASIKSAMPPKQRSTAGPFQMGGRPKTQ